MLQPDQGKAQIKQSQHTPKSGLVTKLDHSNANKKQQTALHGKLTSTNSEHGMHQIVFTEGENDFHNN